jgi:ribosomal protein S18 acetylase RimI-like enzyme
MHAIGTFLQSTVRDLIVRLARPEDRADVFEISSTVWDGNDYIPHVWDAWTDEDSASGFLMVGETDRKVVAVQHVELQRERVAWLEGIRVHEQYRNRGVARRMLKRGLEMAEASEMLRARLSVASQNQASNALVTGEGFYELDRFYSFSAPSGPVLDAYSTGIAAGHGGSEDLPIERRNISDSRLQTIRDAHGWPGPLIVTHGWTAQTVPGQMSPLDFEVSLTIGAQPIGLLLGGVRSRRNRLNIAMVLGTSRSVCCLGEFARQEADRLDLETAGGMLRRDPEVEEGLRLAGYELREDHVMIVYERPLKTITA